jgi:hypothetical protein
MEVECLPRLSRKQQKVLPKSYVPPPIEGTYSIDDKHPEGVIYVYVGYCDWENAFEYCLKEFILTIFHEAMHIMLPEIENSIPYAEKILAALLNEEAKHQVGNEKTP